MTHMGKPKPLYFEENKDRFKDFNITHLIATDYKKSHWKRFLGIGELPKGSFDEWGSRC